MIENTKAFVRAQLGTEGTGHDYWHAHRVDKTAVGIHAYEGGDLLVVRLASWLHDVGDRKVLHQEHDDPTIAHNFLRSQKLGAYTTQSVMHIIEHMSFSKSLDNPQEQKPLEQQIVEDADRLDAMGAIGIARAFAFGGSRGRLLYDPEYTAQKFESSEAYKNAQSSTLHHFDEKLFLLKDLMNTERGRELAEERDAYMHAFVERFMEEWAGNQ